MFEFENETNIRCDSVKKFVINIYLKIFLNIEIYVLESKGKEFSPYKLLIIMILRGKR